MSEMAAPRTDAVWGVLDWAAQQEGEFTINDMWDVYRKLVMRGYKGGLNSYAEFSTTINRYVAKAHVTPGYSPMKDKHRDSKYELSDKRPLIITKGSPGRGGGPKNAARYRWGWTGPLREPPKDEDPLDSELGDMGSDEGDAVGDALDRLEKHLGRDMVKAQLARWKNMTDIHKAVNDIKANIPARLRVDAIHVAAQAIMSKGRPVRQTDVDSAEDQVRGGLPLQKKAKPEIDIDLDDEPTDQDAPTVEPDDDFDFDGEWEEVPDEEEPAPAAKPAAPPPTPSAGVAVRKPAATPPAPPAPPKQEPPKPPQEPKKDEPPKKPSVGSLMKMFNKKK